MFAELEILPAINHLLHHHVEGWVDEAGDMLTALAPATRGNGARLVTRSGWAVSASHAFALHHPDFMALTGGGRAGESLEAEVDALLREIAETTVLVDEVAAWVELVERSPLHPPQRHAPVHGTHSQ